MAIPPNSPSPNDLITNEQLSNKLIFNILQAAYMRTERASDDKDVVVHMRSGIRYLGVFTKRSGSLNFFTLVSLRDNLDANNKLELVNKLNLDSAMAKFVLTEDSLLWVGYDLLTEEGLTPLQILNCLTRFDSIVASVIDDIEDYLQLRSDS